MKPPRTSDPVTSAARQTIRPTGTPVGSPPNAKLIVAHEMPKSPCSARCMYLTYCTTAGRSVPRRCSACAICCGDECWTSTRNPAGFAGTFR